ncbi:MAG: gliding motility-associated C-terminal domain-containing protein [Saprospiraceae bacterium]|nr:gliding motility-associated C-terminal domain-containing protein [Saprospiraceae bacterium]
MKKRLLSILMLFFALLRVVAQQSDCGNIGFEDGHFTGWLLEQGWIGLSNDTLVYGPSFQRTLNEGHRIMSVTEGYDPMVLDENIPVVAPNSRFSARIGNKLTGAVYDRISTTLHVTETNSLLVYKFAIVLQSPNHPDNRQPKMLIKIADQYGRSSSCGTFEVSASRSNSLFKYQARNSLVYRNWTTAAIDLRDYLGQTVTISVTTNDCMEGAHFGYAYFDAECFSSRINISSGCELPSQGITLTAPEGFAMYKWQTGDTTRSIFVRNPVAGTRYSVRVKPYYTLSENCDLTMNFVIPDSFPIQNIQLTKSTCYPTDTGVLVRRFVNTYGCDSVVTLRTNLLRGRDTTFLVFTTCRPQDTQTVVTRLSNMLGCDSFVQKTTILLRGGDTTFLATKSCNPQDTGFFVVKMANAVGCDSFVVRRVSLNTHRDTTYQLHTSCNPLDTGTRVLRLRNALGCDSFVQKKTILLRGGDTTFLTATSCNVRDTGVFVSKLRNSWGCDSFIVKTVKYNPMKISLQTLPTQCQEQTGQINIMSAIGGKPPYMFSLTDSLHFQKEKNFSSLLGRYFTLFVRDSSQCINRFDSILVKRKGCKIFIPNVFSPNQDGVNDEFKIFAPSNYIKLIKTYRIFSRWGNLVYEAPQKNAPFETFTDWWNGNWHNKIGQFISSDVFIYVIEVEYFEEFNHLEETILQGDITVTLNE